MVKDRGAQEQAAAKQKPSHEIAAPTISLPKGGGAIRGMGEKFAANPVTGTGSITVLIATSPSRSGFGPRLSLSYDSGAGNGPFGLGWSLSLPAITRKTDKGLPKYQDTEDSDVLILSGSEDLVPTLAKNAAGKWEPEVIPDRKVGGKVYRIRRYRPRIEGLFARIERWSNSADPCDVHWRSISKDNILTLYGKDGNSRIADPEDPAHIFSWLICETRDDKGSGVLYEYKAEDGTGVDLLKAHERNRGDKTDPRRTAIRYLKRIKYGNRTTRLDQNGQRLPSLTPTQRQNAGWMFEAIFDYGEHYADAPKPDDAGPWAFRNDPFSSHRSGFEVRTTRLCQRVLMFHHIPDLPVGEPGYEGLVRFWCVSATARSATGRTWVMAASALRSQWTIRRGLTSRTSSIGSASAWPTSTAAARLTSSTCIAAACAALLELRRELRLVNRSAAASLEEGLEETLTLHLLGVFGALGHSLKTTNCLESLNAQLGQLTDKVDCWRTSEQKHRWVASALLSIEPRLRRIKGYRHLPQLQAALQREIQREETPEARIA